MTSLETEKLAAEGQRLLDANRLPEARACYEKLCGLDPMNADAHFMLGAICAESGELDAAKSTLHKSLSIDMDNPDAQHVLATVLNVLGENKEALTHANYAVTLDPGFAEAWLLLGSVNSFLNELDAAESACRKAIDLGLSNFEACLTLGDICRIRGKLEDADEFLGKAVEINPDSDSAWLLLGAIQGMSGNHQQAEVSCRRSITLNPDNPEAHKNLGNTLKDQGRYDEAIPVYREAISLDAGNGDAWLGLGTCLIEQGNPREAEACYREDIKLRPDAAAGYCFLSGVLRLSGRYEEAERHVRHAIEISPDFPTVDNELGNVLLARNKLDEARACFDKALEKTPGDSNAIKGIAEIHEKKREFEKSLELLQPLLDRDDTDYQAAIQFSKLSRHFSHHQQAIEMIERLLEQENLGRLARTQLHYRLGKLYDSVDDFHQASRQIRYANQLAEEPYDMARHERLIDGFISTFDKPTIAKLPQASDKSELPVFIVGMPRSGTSLVEQIIATHPRAFGAGELDDMNLIAEELSKTPGVNQPYPGSVASISQSLVDELSQRYLRKLAGLGGDAIRVTDKMPNNFLHLGLIDLFFPGARVIHCVRDPRDTCLSCNFSFFAGNHPYTKDLINLGSYYNQYAKLMQHWKQVLRVPIMDVRYESLVENQEKYSREILDFCGLDWDERCLRFYESDRIVNTASYDQVRQPVYNRSVGRWQRYEQYLEPLINTLDKELLAAYEQQASTD